MVVLVFSSCTMQKRYHNRGFSIGWLNHPSTVGKGDDLGKTQTKRLIHHQDPQVLQSESSVTDVTHISKVDMQRVDDLRVENETTQSVNQISKRQLEKTKADVQILKVQKGSKYPVNKSTSNSTSADGGGSGLRGLGVFFLIIGLIVFVFVSMLIGLLIALLGLIFVISGGSSAGAKNAVAEPAPVEKKIEYVEVLYLKNGSIIRGMIMEQIPNEQVKIQTADGSVFVYTMDQVLKITKEPKNN